MIIIRLIIFMALRGLISNLRKMFYDKFKTNLIVIIVIMPVKVNNIFFIKCFAIIKQIRKKNFALDSPSITFKFGKIQDFPR